MSPMMLKILRVLPVTNRAPKAPIREKGIDRRTVKGCTKLSNCAARTHVRHDHAQDGREQEISEGFLMVSACPL
jgi:hypothetical protein